MTARLGWFWKLTFQISVSASMIGRLTAPGAERKCSSIALAPASSSPKRSKPIAIAIGNRRRTRANRRPTQSHIGSMARLSKPADRTASGAAVIAMKWRESRPRCRRRRDTSRARLARSASSPAWRSSGDDEKERGCRIEQRQQRFERSSVGIGEKMDARCRRGEIVERMANELGAEDASRRCRALPRLSRAGRYSPANWPVATHR
jgi:hypothetical protein